MRFLVLGLGFLFLSACAADRVSAPVVPSAASVGEVERIYFATTRANDDIGLFGIERSSELTLGVSEISVPPNRANGTVQNGGATPEPTEDFAFTQVRTFESAAKFRTSLKRDEDRTGTDNQEVTVFVHGFNNTFSESVFRLAQIKHDMNTPGASVAFSWPSRASALGYEYDDDSTHFSRDGLEKLLREVAKTTRSGIVLVAHSMGSKLTMETLRQIERVDPGWTARTISGIVLISPDLDIDVFKSQMASFREIPQPFIIFASTSDRALRLSAWLTGQPARLGNIPNAEPISEFPVTVIDVTAFSESSGLNHFIPVTSPALIAMFQNAREHDPEFLRGNDATRYSSLNGEQDVVRNATEIVLSPFGR